MQKSFKEQKDGSFELLLDNQNSGIFFHIPPKCKMEDYNIVIIGQQLVSSSRAHFTLNNPPKDMGQIKINSEADIHFENNINIKVNKSLEIGRNNNLVINSYSKAELYFDELLITKNTNTEINLVAEGPRKAAVDYRQIPIAMSSIRNNNFCIFSLGTNIKKFDLANNSSTSQDIPFRISVARADYAIVEGNQVTPTSEDAIIMADVTGGFNLRHAQMTINGKNQIKNDYIPPMDGMFPFTTIRDCAPTFDNSVVETSAISLTVAASSNVVPISFKDEVKLNTERDAKISGQNSLENVVVTCQYESIHLDSNGEIKDSQIEFYTEQGASTYGRTIKGSKFVNAKMTNVLRDLSLFVDNVGVEYTSLVCDKIQMNNSSSSNSLIKFIATSITSGLNASLLTDGVKLEAQNLVLEKGSSLSLTVNSRKDWQCSLSNSIIKGKNMLEGRGEISIRNSVLEDATLINNNHEKKKLTISDSELKGYNRVENIKEIACSSVADSSLISSGEPKIIRDKLLEQVSNLDLFLKSENAEASVITNFDDKLELL